MLLLFFLVWIVFNGRFTLEIALFGIAVSGVMFAFICKFMDYSLQKEWRFCKRIPAFAQYLYCLIKEIVSANLAVSRMILTRRELMEPVIVHVPVDLQTEAARVVLANSITLTPGTITVSMTGNELLVHCLDKSLSEGMADSEFVRLLRKMEEM
ncbi:MAG: Na+/H+ antiporter subunit E [Oscillospiraceae bacterium]|nr:Na+/H+ antiporter subunit E [Oscillospiraceae bacterium]